MNELTNKLIRRWKSYRNQKMLQSPYSARYAFVGVGNHALQNLYPVLQYLGIRLKYICCKTPGKLQQVEQRFNVAATTSLDDVLNDDEVKGVFVCVSPESHFHICKRIIEAGKYLFVEKPPCQTITELESLIGLDVKQKVVVGMQKRYSPYIQTLKEKLKSHDMISYNMVYRTGAYSEGNPYTDLFIHAVDLSVFLFGKVEIRDFQLRERNGAATIQMLLSHGNVMGFIELSTAFSWSNPEEKLRINTTEGEYRLIGMERLCHYPHPKKCLGVPLEKIGIHTVSEQIIAERNNFNPLLVNNQLYSQGFLSEIQAFAEFVECSGKNYSPLSNLKETYRIMDAIQNE
ncbi:Gfo/Idh/MocA family protein [Lepagella muris]|uniref:Gfo/Idh/MocA family oxidoreductase n=1 Tax=Lepagella muris TaxID=3032870 RepID=A0AC61RHW2_9BACT|nr:Gfo/Idh/MocA family oxidoreductase [Lepagella muris]ROT02957.1 gfo/Idh/MocA family oxidoreductase [Muribaculaceae bacterium Isolate-037 (Harlan)]TGY80293.1 Gfo/Idh/MocA family oxidoreductase [Lepagella muris]THG52832.1 Gfo/Idh/MocA family oxidoreductase [Bacteroidales bacterium]TKC58718.1 Gfo/Idh/MocA family oxidoreductase [Bacteroidales bacterium]